MHRIHRRDPVYRALDEGKIGLYLSDLLGANQISGFGMGERPFVFDFGLMYDAV